MKHTKGKWFVFNEDEILDREESIGIECKKDSGEEVSIIVFTDDVEWNSPEENLANAKLIAAAPELLGALRAMLHIFDRGLSEKMVGRNICDEAKNAIKKATE